MKYRLLGGDHNGRFIDVPETWQRVSFVNYTQRVTFAEVTLVLEATESTLVYKSMYEKRSFNPDGVGPIHIFVPVNLKYDDIRELVMKFISTWIDPDDLRPVAESSVIEVDPGVHTMMIDTEKMDRTIVFNVRTPGGEFDFSISPSKINE